MRSVIKSAGFVPVPIEYPVEQLSQELSVVIISTAVHVPRMTGHRKGSIRSVEENFTTVCKISKEKLPYAPIVLATEHQSFEWLAPIMQYPFPNSVLIPVDSAALENDLLASPTVMPVFRHVDIMIDESGNPKSPESFSTAVKMLQALAEHSRAHR